MPLTDKQKDIAYVAFLVALSQPRPSTQKSFLKLLQETPDPAAITNDLQAKKLFTSVDPALYTEVHGKAVSLNGNSFPTAEGNLSRIATNMTSVTNLLRSNHPWDPNTVCENMIDVIANVDKIA